MAEVSASKNFIIPIKKGESFKEYKLDLIDPMENYDEYRDLGYQLDFLIKKDNDIEYLGYYYEGYYGNLWEEIKYMENYDPLYYLVDIRNKDHIKDINIIITPENADIVKGYLSFTNINAKKVRISLESLEGDIIDTFEKEFKRTAIGWLPPKQFGYKLDINEKLEKYVISIEFYTEKDEILKYYYKPDLLTLDIDEAYVLTQDELIDEFIILPSNYNIMIYE